LDQLQGAAEPQVTTLALEREMNTFLRLTSATIIDELRQSFPDLPAEPTPKHVFLKLRELRNRW
jgi:hydroxyacylglutathione hydrolase